MSRLKNNRIWYLIGLGYLQWFFGNLYELQVLTPNIMLAPSIPDALHKLQSFWQLSNPTWYFLPWSPLTILLTWITVSLNYRHADHKLKKLLLVLLLSSLLLTITTAIIITKINLRLYIHHQALGNGKITDLIWLGFHLGNFRLVLELIILVIIYKIIKTNYPIKDE